LQATVVADTAAPPVTGADTSVASTAVSSTSAVEGLTGLRVEIATGCPASVLAVASWGSTSPEFAVNPDSTGLADSFVAGEPGAALICRYRLVRYDASGQPISGGDLFSSTVLDGRTAGALAREANGVTPSAVVSACLFGDSDHARYTGIVFAVPGRTDIDLWLKEWVGCPGMSNGFRDSGELINGIGSSFLELLDTDAPPPAGR